jgi:iron complex outermembrane recepter protein
MRQVPNTITRDFMQYVAARAFLGPRPASAAARHLGRLSLVAAAAALACVPSLVLAQPAALQEPAAASVQQEGAALPTVRVSAKRDNNKLVAKDAAVGALGDLPLIETPFSVNVVTRELIERQQAAFVGDVLKNEPSATIGNVAVPFLLLRGFSLGSDGTLFDGLPGNNGLSDGRAGMQAIDRVEVLKGAAAVLYGVGSASSLGGSINYIPKRPTEAPIRSVGVGFTNRALWSAEADLGDRFGDDRQFGWRANLGWRDGEQAVARYDWNQQVASLALDWRAVPGLVFNLGFDHVDNHIPTLPPFYIVAPGVDVPKAPDTQRSAAMSWDDFKTRSDTVTFRTDWALSTDWTLTAQALSNRSARPTTKEARFGQITNEAGDIVLFGSQDVSSQDADNAQVLLHGNVATGSVQHKLTLGATTLRQESRGNGAFLGMFASNLYDPVDAPEPDGVSVENVLGSRTHSRSLMVSDIVEFGPNWSVLLGARRASLTVDNFDGATGERASRNAITKTLPTAALMFKPQPGALVYLNLARGLEQGGSVSPTNSSQFLPPRQTRQVELGAKLERDGMTYTAALFVMRRPLEIFDATLGQNVQRGTEQHRGIEMVANGRVSADLSVVGGLMWMDTTMKGTGDPVSDGKGAVGVPRLMANLWGEYRVAAVQGLALNAGVYHAGRQPLDAANTQWVPAWTRCDIGASWDTAFSGISTRWMLTIENVADKDYWASAQSGILTMADPRTIKLGARFHF